MTEPQGRNITTISTAKLRSHLWVRRFNNQLTQQQLAERVGVSRNTISQIETGKTVPSVLLSLCIAKELNTKVEDVFQLQ